MTESGHEKSKLLGSVKKYYWENSTDKEVRVFEYTTKSFVSLPATQLPQCCRLFSHRHETARLCTIVRDYGEEGKKL